MNDLLILALLLEGPKHGYALKKAAATMFGPRDMHNNLVYPLLRRFVAQKWVTVKKAKGERGQTRQVYSLTPTGKEALANRLRDFSPVDAESLDQFSVRVGLFDILSPVERIAILDRRKAYLEERAARLGLFATRMDAGTFPGQVVSFLGGSAQAELVWIEKLRQLAGAPHERSSPKLRSEHS
ncbi:MAG: PadR family transcriptional regulator [Candidatus Acidiferrales bacterium]